MEFELQNMKCLHFVYYLIKTWNICNIFENRCFTNLTNFQTNGFENFPRPKIDNFLYFKFKVPCSTKCLSTSQNICSIFENRSFANLTIFWTNGFENCLPLKISNFLYFRFKIPFSTKMYLILFIFLVVSALWKLWPWT